MCFSISMYMSFVMMHPCFQKWWRRATKKDVLVYSSEIFTFWLPIFPEKVRLSLALSLCNRAWISPWVEKMLLFTAIKSSSPQTLSQTAHIKEFPGRVQTCMFLGGQWGLLEPGNCKCQLKSANPSGWICAFKPQQGQRKFQDVLVASFTKGWCGIVVSAWVNIEGRKQNAAYLTKPFTNMKGQIMLIFWAD